MRAEEYISSDIYGVYSFELRNLDAIQEAPSETGNGRFAKHIFYGLDSILFEARMLRNGDVA